MCSERSDWLIVDLEAKKKQSEMDKKAIDELTRERDILNKSLTKAASSTIKQVNLVKLHEQSKKNLEQEITNYKEEAQKQRKIIYQLEKERDKYINEASELTQKVCYVLCDWLGVVAWVFYVQFHWLVAVG